MVEKNLAGLVICKVKSVKVWRRGGGGGGVRAFPILPVQLGLRTILNFPNPETLKKETLQSPKRQTF